MTIQERFDRFFNFVVNNYLKILVALTAIFVFFVFQVPSVNIDNSVDNFLPDDHSQMQMSEKYKDIFGPGSGILVAIEAEDIFAPSFLQKLGRLTSRLDKLDTKIIADQQQKNRQTISDLFGFSVEEVDQANMYLQTLSVSDVDGLDTKMKREEIELYGVESALAAEMVDAWNAFSPENKERLLRALSPAYVKEAISIMNADYVEGEDDEFRVEEIIQSTNINKESIANLKMRLDRWDIYDSYLVSKNEKAVSIIIRLYSNKKELAEVVLEYVKQELKEFYDHHVEFTFPGGRTLAGYLPAEFLAKHGVSEIAQKLARDQGRKNEFAPLFRNNSEGKRLPKNKRIFDPAQADSPQKVQLGEVTVRIKNPLFDKKENKHYIAGEPVVTTLLGTYMVNDLKLLLPFVIIVVMLTLLLAFRQFGPMIIPLLCVLFSTVIVIGLMAMLGVPLTVISIVLPVLLIAVGSAYGIHLVNHFLLSEEKDRKQAVRTSLAETFTPVAMAAFTTIGGFAALISNEVVPIRNFGMFTAIGVALSFLMAVLLVPSLLLFFRTERKSTVRDAESSQTGRANKFLKNISSFSLRRSWWIIGGALVILVLSIAGAFRVQVDTDAVRMFKESSYIRRSDNYMNKHFRGTSTVDIVLTNKKINGALTPRYLRALDGLDDYLSGETVPEEVRTNYGGLLSVVDYLKKANKALHGEDPAYYRIPDKQQEILDYMLILKNSTEDVCNRDGTKIKALLTMKSGSTTIAHKLRTEVYRYFASKGFDGENRPDFSGILAMYLAIDTMVVQGQIFSIILSLLVVLVLNSVVFRSFIQAAVSLGPLCVAIMINFGIMGFWGLLLDVGTSMIASVAIGIGIDYTIHYMNGFKVRYKHSDDLEQSLLGTGITTGRAILFNMVAVMFGFAVLPFSSFIPLINFGALIAITMLTTGFASLTLIPAIMSRLSKMRFIQKMVELERQTFSK